MDKEHKKLFDEMVEKVNEMELEIQNLTKDRVNYSQKDIFTHQVVFRGPVYDKRGNKIMN